MPNSKHTHSEVEGVSGFWVNGDLSVLEKCDLCVYTSDCATHEKEKDYHESTKYRKHEKTISNLISMSYFVFSYLRVFVIDFE